jgi:hypothetical protein
MSHRGHITRCTVVAAALTIRLAPFAAAQARSSLSLDATIGVSTGSGGRQLYNASSSSIAGEATLGVRFHPERAIAALGALSVGRRGRFEGNGDGRCVVPPPTVGANDECEPPFPNPSHVGFLGGIEARDGELSLRALAGPAFYAGDGPSGVGAQAQLDAAAGFSRLAFLVAVRQSWMSRVTGESLRFRSLEVGVRLQ